MMDRKLNIYLVGLPGSGKTTVGKALEKKLKKTFFDSDHFLIDKTGVSIKTIFDLEGEIGFRQREKKAIEEIVSKENIILATGGGAILDVNNRELLKRTGFVIYLQAKPGFLFKRMQKDTSRPLLQGFDPLQKLTELYEQRVAFYNEVSDVVYPIDEKTPSLHQCVVELIAIIDHNTRE